MWMHMFSSENTMGTLTMDILVDGIWHDDVQNWSGDHGDEWFWVEQDLSDYKGENVQFRFRAVTGDDWAGDICIDDFVIDNMSQVGIETHSVINQLSMRMQGSRLNYTVPHTLSGSDLTIELFDLRGRHLFSLERNGVQSGAYVLDLSTGRSSLANGFYITKMRCGDRTLTSSILLQR